LKSRAKKEDIRKRQADQPGLPANRQTQVMKKKGMRISLKNMILKQVMH
jgi:hypothetical protein